MRDFIDIMESNNDPLDVVVGRLKAHPEVAKVFKAGSSGPRNRPTLMADTA
jgi:hypothetical protein